MCPKVLDDTSSFLTDQLVSRQWRPRLHKHRAVSRRNSSWGSWAWVVIHKRQWYSCRLMYNHPYKDHCCYHGSHTQGRGHQPPSKCPQHCGRGCKNCQHAKTRQAAGKLMGAGTTQADDSRAEAGGRAEAGKAQPIAVEGCTEAGVGQGACVAPAAGAGSASEARTAALTAPP